MVTDGYSVLVNGHEFLGESVMGEKSVLYFREGERLSSKSKNISSVMVKDDLEALLSLGRSQDGFVKNDLRRPVWLKILKSRIAFDASRASSMGKEWSDIVSHKDEHQVSLDVRRSFGDIKDDAAKAFLRQALEQTIVRVLRKFPQLNYYQGYHDVVAVFVLVFLQTQRSNEDSELSDSTSGSSSIAESEYHDNLSSSSISTKLADDSVLSIDGDLLFEAVVIFTLLYLRDFMMNSLTFTIDQLSLIPLIIKRHDTNFYNRFQLHQIDPFFALSSILTLFSHDLRHQSQESLSIVFQIFDLVISFNSMMVPLTIYSNLLLAKKEDLSARLQDNLQNFDNDTDLIHGVIQQEMIVGSGPQLWNSVLEATRKSDNSIGQETKRVVNKFSVLMTERALPVTIEESLNWLEQEVRLSEARSTTPQGYRPPAVSRWKIITQSGGPTLVKMSLFVGFAAILLKLYMRTLDNHSGSSIFTLKSYFDHLKTLKFSGLRQPRRVWLDPIQNLLETIGRRSTS
ncbi:LADA_0C11276g1_1 [Lachancea dasiensis]|uniref:LADA_0C11276g1_1 n=1 Tax=Lachancea dasiensis TaxID=1072105 RepID=A0A1G4J1I6_9SACH|nr:LADA_0C11276g1_1 [Lachancea dasiensis]